MERALLKVKEACATWAARYVEHNQLAFADEVRRVVEIRNLDAGSVVDLQALVDETAQKVTRNASQHDGDASIGTAGLRGEGEFRWSSRGPRAIGQPHSRESEVGHSNSCQQTDYPS